MNIRCPICNVEMLRSKPDQLIITDETVETPHLFQCVNDECIIQPELPEGWSSPAANAMANCVIALTDQCEALTHKVYTKKRDGRMEGFKYGIKLVQRAMGAVGYSMRRKGE